MSNSQVIKMAKFSKVSTRSLFKKLIIFSFIYKLVECQNIRTNNEHLIKQDAIENKHNSTENKDISSNAYINISENSSFISDNSQSVRNKNKWRHNTRRRNRKGNKQDALSDFNWLADDFVITDNLPDGEREKRIRYKGKVAKETAAGSNRSGLILRQFAEGRHFVQTISDATGKMIDCEYLKDKDTVRKFIKDFNKEISSYFAKNKKHEERKRRKYNAKRNYRRRYSHIQTERRNRMKNRARMMKNDRDEKIDKDIVQSDLVDDYETVLGVDDVEDIYRDDYKLLKRPRSKRDVFSDEDDYLPDYSEFDPETSINLFENRDRYKNRRNNKRRPILADTYDKNTLKNVTVLKMSDDLPDSISEWLNYKSLKESCDSVHERLKETLGMDKVNEDEDPTALKRSSRSLRGMTIIPGMLWCGGGDIAETPKELGLFRETDSCCRAHDLCPKPNLPSFTRRHGLFNFKSFTLSHCECDKRDKRGASMLIPGTRWCGRGGSATRHAELGAFGGADRCCRRHDTTCPFWISAAESKYGIFNWRPNTLMHCRCDERFRSCLKMANSDAANMVGRLFFNVVQTRCFVLKPAKVCIDRSWWGKCLKVGYTKQAHLRENPSY